MISALKEIERLKLNSKKHKDIPLKYEKKELDLEYLIKLKVELEESRKIEDILKREIKEKNQECEKLEEVVSLRKKSEKAQRELTMNIPQMKSFGQLDQILNAQRSPLIKAGIGYEGETSKSKVEDNNNIIFV